MLRCFPILLALIATTHSRAWATPPEPLPPNSGAALYERYCRTCHGADHKGYAADNAPSLASSSFLRTASDAFLRSAIERGRAGTAMGGYGKQYNGPLDAADIDELIRYLRGGTRPVALPARELGG